MKVAKTEILSNFKKVFTSYGKTSPSEAENVYEEIISLLKFNLLNLEAEEIKLNQKVNSCEKKLEGARVNYGLPLEENSNYVINLINAKNNLTIAENNLKENSDKLDFLRSELSYFHTK